MEQLLYISTARAEVPSEDEIRNILSVSRQNNRRDGLSGLLIVGGRRFLQVLEGPAAQLQAAYARIKQDPRHFAIVELSRRPIAERSFADWEMGYKASGGDLPDLVRRLTADVRDPSLQAQLQSFAELHAKAA